eukprot:4960628-Ditylum_brightwellii.AAC.1
MYGLPQAGHIAHDQLKLHLAKHGYHPVQHTPGLLRHENCDITFCLVVDDFGIKYTNISDVQHLIQALQTLYEITIDWTRKLFCRISLHWNYRNYTVDLSMPGYIENALHKFQHVAPKKTQHLPHIANHPMYTRGPQIAPESDLFLPLTAKQKNRVHQVLSTLLFYARSVEPTMLVAISSITAQQAALTRNTVAEFFHLLNYAATQPDAVLRYHASGMVLHIHSDTSFMPKTKVHSHAGGYYFLSEYHNNPTNATEDEILLNGPIHSVYKIIHNTMVSTAEVEVGALFINTRKGDKMRVALEEMGHPQLATPNSTAYGIINSTVKQLYWAPENLVAYATSFHHPSNLRRCVELAGIQTTWTWDWNSVQNTNDVTTHDVISMWSRISSPQLTIDY